MNFNVLDITSRTHPMYRLWIFCLTVSKYFPIFNIRFADKYKQGIEHPYYYDHEWTPELKLAKLESNIPKNLCQYINKLFIYFLIQWPLILICFSILAMTIAGLLYAFAIGTHDIFLGFYHYGINFFFMTAGKNPAFYSGLIVVFLIWFVIFAIPTYFVSLLGYDKLKPYLPAKVEKPKKPSILAPVIMYIKDKHDGVCRHLEFHD